ncbi:hypothetical protein E2C01_039645 [Portunus trituberculatus]|uniref:Uncharacterized protein n=1 Tax=Portunus trituberculatus TaxID=210409 RepID=A0A5B7FLA2_PORTR|nr:hypothetical protein [Portunus trituberculatus]
MVAAGGSAASKGATQDCGATCFSLYFPRKQAKNCKKKIAALPTNSRKGIPNQLRFRANGQLYEDE